MVVGESTFRDVPHNAWPCHGFTHLCETSIQSLFLVRTLPPPGCHTLSLSRTLLLPSDFRCALQFIETKKNKSIFIFISIFIFFIVRWSICHWLLLCVSSITAPALSTQSRPLVASAAAACFCRGGLGARLCRAGSRFLWRRLSPCQFKHLYSLPNIFAQYLSRFPLHTRTHTHKHTHTYSHTHKDTWRCAAASCGGAHLNKTQ